MTASQPGQLFIVSTPIGNLNDMTARAIEVLQSVQLIAAEDTRHSRPLLQHFGIGSKLISLHEHNEQQRSEMLIEQLLAGDDVGLISDAGTPLISDPGFRLVSLARENGIRVIPIPGCCAVITALSASGLPSDRFSFEGFLPSKTSARKHILASLKNDQRTLIFYESPRRLEASLTDMIAVFGADRRVCLARELTKLHETIETRMLSAMLEWVSSDINQQRGECVVLVEGASQLTTATEQELLRVLELLLTELPVKKAAALAASLTGGSKNEAYQLALKLQQK